MQDCYTTDQIRLMREATALAAAIVGTSSDYDKSDIANYVLSAFESGLTDIDNLAHRASQQFLLWNLHDDQTAQRTLQG